MITEDVYITAYDLYINNIKNNYKDIYQTSTFFSYSVFKVIITEDDKYIKKAIRIEKLKNIIK